MQPLLSEPGEPANDVVTSAPAPPGAWERLRAGAARLAAGPRARQFAARFTSTYLAADARSLAAGRIALASVLLLDLFKRWVQLGSWYTNEGLLPNHTLLWRPSFAHVFSFFYMASYTHEAVIGFVLCALAYTALLVGLYTRLAQVLSMVAVMSLHGRLLLFDNGGDVVLGLLAIWTAFLPTGGRWSVDAVLGRSVARPRVVGLGVLALTCQLAFIYFFNAVHKAGETWREGTAVHYVMHLDRLATPLAVWLRARMTPGLSRAMSWTALGIEWSLPFLLLSPFATRACRRAAIALVIALHGGFALFMNLGNFVPAMLAYTPHFVHGDDWDALERWWRRSPARARRSAILEWRVAGALRRAGAFFSLGRSVRLVPPGPAVSMLLGRLPLLRELACAAFVFVAANQLLDENAAAHRVWDHHNAPPVAAAVTYLNLFQGWSMFAPEVNKTDINLAVDAVTVTGRHVDPWNEAANPKYPMPGATIPPAMGPNWLFYQYVTRLPWWPAYDQAFQEWIQRYPQRTGRKEDEIVSLKVYKVEDDSPPPGQTQPTNPRATLLFEWAAAPRPPGGAS
ncbi:MAG TPA: HTTM domain-containing protein [Polyangia bacterium]|nr:HTTM domain-containing protein [Polyangia bacterium]